MAHRASVSVFLPLIVALLAVAPRVEPALRGFRWSPDAAEHALIARSLAGGNGFTLPIRVRQPEAEPVVHEAYGERAPLYPWLLSLFSHPEPGWPSPVLQLINVVLAALAAWLACSLTWVVGRRRGLAGLPLTAAVVLGGLSVAWVPNLVRASVHLWAEPLGLVLVLASLRLLLSESPRLGTVVVAGVLAGLARFARPEAWVLVPLLPLAAWWLGRRREAAALAVSLGVVNLVLIGVTGVIAPQLELLQVTSYEAMMAPGTPTPPTALEVVQGIGRNAVGQLGYLLLPKNAFLILPLALIAARRRQAWALLLPALALALATVMVWSTADPSRFTILPLCLLAPVAAVEAVALVGRLPAERRRVALAAVLGAWVAVLGHAGGREWRKESRLPAIQVSDFADRMWAVTHPEGAWRIVGPAERTDDPWSYALLTGGRARLARPAPP